MATCKDCIHYEVCKHHAKMLEEDGYEIEFDDTPEVEKRCAAFKLISDVVPKSEVEKLIIDRNAARLGMIAEGHNDPRGEDGAEGEDGQGDLNPLYCMKKAEVAREIFEEIERYAELNIEELDIAEKVEPRAKEFFGGGKQAFDLLLDKLAELKKKYTEGE